MYSAALNVTLQQDVDATVCRMHSTPTPSIFVLTAIFQVNLG